MWQLATLRNDFLPRLGGQIKYISLSEDDQFASVTLVNNGMYYLKFTELNQILYSFLILLSLNFVLIL